MKNDINDTLRNEGPEAVRARSDNAPVYKSAKTKKLNGKDDHEPLAYIDIARQPIPARKWAVHDRIPAGNVSLFSGEGAAGKSGLLLQQSVAHVLTKDWIGTVPEPGPVIYVSCEDDEDELCRRLEAITKHYGASRSDLIGALHTISLVGKDATLATFDRNGLIHPTELFYRLQSDILRIRPKLVGLDTAADLFAGSEIDRGQTRRFITLLRGPARETDAAIVLVSHPSLTGIASGSGLSGSTAWHNSVRARMYLKAYSEGDDDKDSGLRILEFKKNNYGPISESVILRWRDGVYLPEPKAGSIEKAAENQKVDDVFLRLLRKLTANGRNVSPNPSITFAPTVFAKEREAKEAKVSSDAFRESMARLFDANKICVEGYGPPSHGRSRVAEVKS